MTANHTGKSFTDLTKMNYEQQAKYFLNCYWPEMEPRAEDVFKWWQKFCELDIKNHEKGNEIDEFPALQFLQWFGKPLDRSTFRNKLREVDPANDGRMSFVEFLCFESKKTVPELLNTHPGTEHTEYTDAKRNLEAINAIFKAREDEVAMLEAKVKAGTASGIEKNNLAQKRVALGNISTEEKAQKIKCENAMKKASVVGPIKHFPADIWWDARVEVEKQKNPQRGSKRS